MLWIPIAFICLPVGCTFMSGEPEYSATDCFKTLEVADRRLQKDPNVILFQLDCVAVSPT